eukprot:evm.model.scf_42.14 EVM.evm.TU.scf_42.14   scf_42:93671-99960(-)
MRPAALPPASIGTGGASRSIRGAAPVETAPAAGRARAACRAGSSSRSETRVANERGLRTSIGDEPIPAASASAIDGALNGRRNGDGDAGEGGGHLDIFAEDFPTSEEGEAVGAASGEEGAGKEPTELIFKLDRRGYGWGEEIIPNVTIERRPIESKRRRQRNRSKGPNPWEDGSLEQFLVEMGVPNEHVEVVAAAAIAWRVTPGGRPLIDRRRRSRVERNMWAVAEHLMVVCGMQPGCDGIGDLLLQAPQILLAKPTQHDRWYRRVVELAGYMHRFGHCNVPENWAHNPELALWVKRQRAAKVEGDISQERLQILHALGFEFGEVAVITQEWENWFDTLVEWLMLHAENGEQLSWSGLDWYARGGWKFGQLAVWADLQRELRKRNLLPKEAVQRLSAIKFCWEPETSTANLEWMSHFRELVYVSERWRMKSRRRSAYSPGDIMIPSDTASTRTSLDAFSSQRSKNASTGQHAGKQDEEGPSQHKWPKMQRLTGMKLDSRVQYWLLKQRWLWRQGSLSRDKASLFLCAGIDLNDYSKHTWIQTAFVAASFLTGFDVDCSKKPGMDASSRDKSDPQLSPRLYIKPEDVMAVTEEGDVIEWPSDLKLASHSERTSALVNGATAAVGGAAVAVTGQRGGSGGDRQAMQSAESSFQSPRSGVRHRKAKQVSADETHKRLKVRRWVMTQQALFQESRLSEQQIRHMVFLGLGWLLSMEDSQTDVQWSESYRELSNVVWEFGSIPATLPTQVHEWLNQQRSLRRIGMLDKDRVQRLNELGVDWMLVRSQDEKVWDHKLMEILEFKRVHGHCKVAQKSRQLASWLAQQQDRWRKGTLPKSRVDQLRALGVSSCSS